MSFFLSSLLLFLIGEWTSLEEAELVVVEQYFNQPSPVLRDATGAIIKHHYGETMIGEWLFGDIPEYYHPGLSQELRYDYFIIDVIISQFFNMTRDGLLEDKSNKRFLDCYVTILKSLFSDFNIDMNAIFEGYYSMDPMKKKQAIAALKSNGVQYHIMLTLSYFSRT